MRSLAIGIAALLVVGVIAVSRREGGDGHHYPKEWDPRVKDLASFVEKTRGRRFEHPVTVRFLTPAEYTKATSDETDDSDEDTKASLERGTGQLRALGLVSGPIDLHKLLTQLTDAGTLAFYSPDDKVVRVRGTEMTVGLRVTLVHELTHALQDQAFDLSRFIDESKLDNSESIARHALAEGDALRTEDAYVAKELTPQERSAYDQEYGGQVDTSEAATKDVPDFIQATFAEPYALGAPFVQMLLNDGGNGKVDDAFHHPPSTEENLFDPASYLLHEGDEQPDLDLRAKVEEDGPFGSPSWFLVLATRIDPSIAFNAALGWGGDQYAVFERSGRTCVRAVFRGDTTQDEKEMRSALEAWAPLVPGGKAKHLEVRGHPGFEACDPGPDVDMHVVSNSSDVLILPNVWGYLVAEAAPQLGPKGARCFASHVIEGYTYQQLGDPAAQDELTRQVASRAVEAYVACGSRDT